MGQKKYVFHPSDHAGEHQDASMLNDTLKEPVVDEKGHPAYVGENEEVDFEKSDQDVITVDPFVPFNDLPDERHWVVTFRAMVSASVENGSALLQLRIVSCTAGHRYRLRCTSQRLQSIPRSQDRMDVYGQLVRCHCRLLGYQSLRQVAPRIFSATRR